jgi:branched-chain amino acid transport system substrate-binding protein
MTNRDVKPTVVARLPRNSMKYEAAVAEIGKASPQAVIVIATGKTTSAIIQEIKKANLSPQFFVLSNNSTAAFVKDLGEDRPGVGVAQVTPFPFSPTAPLVKEFQQVTKGRADVPVSYTAFEGFIAAKVMVEGLRRAGRDLTRERLVAALETLNRLDIGGMEVSYGPGVRTGALYVELTVIGHNGKFFH